MPSEITLRDGIILTKDEVILCGGSKSIYHDLIYLGRKSKLYKCRRCLKLFNKDDVKALTDSEGADYGA